MQRKSVGKVIRCLMVAVLLISSFALFACGGGDGDDGEGGSGSNTPVLPPNQDQPVPLNAATAQALIPAVLNQPFTIPDGSSFSTGIPANTPLTLRFTGTPTTAANGTVTAPFTLTTPGGQTANGIATFASCTFTVSTSTIPGLLNNTAIPTFDTCNFTVRAATAIVAGGGSVTGTITALVLGRGGVILIIATLPANSGITITISIRDDGHLIINGVDTSVVIPPPPGGQTGTGTTGTGGTP